MKLKRLIQLLLCVFLLILLPESALAKGTPIFQDIPETFWAYDAVVALAEKGLLNGTTNGNGIVVFAPYESLTRAQLVSILTRYLYNEELNNMPDVSGSLWYANNYALAIKYGLLNGEEYELSDLEQNCSRQELAYHLMNALLLGNNKEPDRLVPISNIADYNTIDPVYRKSVRQAYSLGLLSGIDSIGTFSPQGVLNRAQVASVLYRLIDPSTRVAVSLDETTEFTWSNGTSYKGVILNGEANGFGQMVYPKIGSYTGYFVNGKREGIGTFQWLVGDKYVGNWKDDMMSGDGIYTFSDGYSIKGPWEENLVKIRKFSLSESSLVVYTGNAKYLVAKFEPTNATEAIVWTSSDSKILQVSGEDNFGTLLAVAEGTARVTATTQTGLVSSCAVTVKAKPTPVKQILLNYGDYTLKPTGQVNLRAIFNPYNAADVKVLFSSSNPTVASVNSNGVVTAVSVGSTVISCTTENGLVATCYVTVIDPFKELWSGSWDIFDSDSAGRKKYTSLPSIGSGLFNLTNMSVSLSTYPFSGGQIIISKSNEYTLLGTFKSSSFSYDLAFTSINNNQIILEVKSIFSSLYTSDSVTATYYVLYRR